MYEDYKYQAWLRKQGDGIKVEEQLAGQASVLPSRAKRGELTDNEIMAAFHSCATLDQQMVDTAVGIAPSSCIAEDGTYAELEHIRR
jgi:hypothetical protein